MLNALMPTFTISTTNYSDDNHRNVLKQRQIELIMLRYLKDKYITLKFGDRQLRNQCPTVLNCVKHKCVPNHTIRVE